MSYPVIWLPEAEITFKKNLDYLEAEWSVLVKDDFLNRLEKVIGLIASNPNLYPIHRKNWNSYQNPKQLKL